MNDDELLAKIAALVEEEHQLEREQSVHAHTPADARQRMRAIEISLDQCWDLLRQRRARRSAGQDDDAAQLRNETTVEDYTQ